MKKLFRHYSTWLLLIGVTVSLFAFLNGADIYQRIQYALAEVNEYHYKNSYSISISGIKDMGEVIGELKKLDGNVVIYENLIYQDATEYYQLVNLIVKQDEELPYPIEYISDEGNVILGEGLREYCYQNEASEMVIKLNGREQKILGFFVNGYSDLLNSRIYLILDEDNMETLLGTQDSLDVEYGSNQFNVDSSFDTFMQMVQEKYFVVYEKDAGKYIEVGSYNTNEKFYLVIALFAMINCVVISEFWVLRRKEEILIRKLWGFSNRKLFGLMYREMLAVSGLAVTVNLLIKALLYIINGRESGTMLVQKILLAFIFMIISSFIMVAVPVHHASKYKNGDGLEV